MPKKIDFILFFTVLLFIFPVLSASEFCENCPQTECRIRCNTTKTGSTSTWHYYNFTIESMSDVKIRYINPPTAPFQNYDLFVNMTPGECPTNTSYTNSSTNGPGSNDTIYLLNLAPGTYHLLIECEQNCGEYNLSLWCGKFCGDGYLTYFESCDLSSATPHGSCEAYEACNESCECEDIRTEAIQCTYYDYCEDGMDPTDPSKYCCINTTTGTQQECCINATGQPVANCSEPGAQLNLGLELNDEYCYNSGFFNRTEIFARCVDPYYINHQLWEVC